VPNALVCTNAPANGKAGEIGPVTASRPAPEVTTWAAGPRGSSKARSSAGSAPGCHTVSDTTTTAGPADESVSAHAPPSGLSAENDTALVPAGSATVAVPAGSVIKMDGGIAASPPENTANTS
jgi:hypothetical protein